MNSVPALMERISRKTAARLTEIAVHLLEQDRSFRVAFPREPARRGSSAQLPFATAVALCSVDSLAVQALSAAGRGVLAALALPAGSSAPPIAAIAAAEEFLAAAARLAPLDWRHRLITGQIAWLRGADDAALNEFTAAAAVADSRRGASVALLHRALLLADRSELASAIELGRRAALLRPDHVAAHWTTALYAAIARRRGLAEAHWQAAFATGRPRALRSRALALDRHCAALAERGLESHPRCVRLAAEIRERVAPHLAAGARS